jgi:hypothetical protein
VATGVRVLRCNPATGATIRLDFLTERPVLRLGSNAAGRPDVHFLRRPRQHHHASADGDNAVVSVAIAPSLTVPGALTAVVATAGDSSVLLVNRPRHLT